MNTSARRRYSDEEHIMNFTITHIVRNGLILPLTDDVVFHEFLSIISHMTGINELAAFGSAELADNDA